MYEAAPLIPIGNQQYASYLKAKDGWAQAFAGKELPIDLRSFVTNRFAYCVPINPNNDRTQMVVDQ